MSDSVVKLESKLERELRVMAELDRLLRDLEDDAKQRVLQWAMQRTAKPFGLLP